MEIGICQDCGCEIYGGRNLLGCRMMCEECLKAEEEARDEEINMDEAA